MFEPSRTPRVFALPCGTDFPSALVDGLTQRCKNQPPEALAKVELIVNTQRMERRIRNLFDAGPNLLLPRISLLSDLSKRPTLNRLPPAMPPLRRRLQLSQLVSKLLDAQPDLAARSSLFDLSDSLAALFDEMQGEGVTTDKIRSLDVSDMSDHWARAQSFIGIADEFTAHFDDTMDVETRQRQAAMNLIDHWKINPPQHPVIVAGSTGSRGTTLMLMQAIAQLPQGVIILPGFDFDQPEHVWHGLDDPLISEDHPQYRFHKLMTELEVPLSQVLPWTDTQPAATSRNKLVSLALRPAPVTDAWMSEGPLLTHLDKATENVTLLEAPNPRGEALAIAMRLRQAAEDGQTAALITPDRMLTRQVSAALDRWDILPDDSAGQPLQLSPPGRFLRHVAELFCKVLAGDTLLTLLKHPLTHDGASRGDHLRHSRELELQLRSNGPPFPDGACFDQFGSTREVLEGWTNWLTENFADQVITTELPLAEWVSRLRSLSEAISSGSQVNGTGTVWDKKAGREAQRVIQELEAEAGHGGEMSARDFVDLLGVLLSQGEVRDRDAPHGKIMIWGTLEARVQGADLVILGGLNEGSWPEAAKPDPWLNRQLRNQAGLLLPERRVGLSAHDFQQAIAAPEVWITRAIRSDDSDTVASRWLNRLCNLLDGLPDQNGPDVLQAMRDRGKIWLDWAEALEEPTKTQPALRPSPCPPVSSRPRRLTITEIPRLIRDPYAIYAKHVLRLKVLNPLVHTPDALLRGIVVHEVFEHFIKETQDNPSLLNREHLLQKSRELLEEHVPWPVARCLWLARLNRIAGDFIQAEQSRRLIAQPKCFEAKGEARLDQLDFTIACRADRIDMDDRGFLHLYDYKTGAPPSETQQLKFEKQLLIEAAMAEQGAFEDIGPAEVSRALFIGLGTTMKEVRAPLDKDPPTKVWEELHELISAYFEPTQGFSSRRMLHLDTDHGDYDHLARFGEWDRSATPVAEDLT